MIFCFLSVLDTESPAFSFMHEGPFYCRMHAYVLKCESQTQSAQLAAHKWTKSDFVANKRHKINTALSLRGK